MRNSTLLTTYAFIRNAWLQRREYQVKDGDVADDIPLDELEDLEDPEAPAAIRKPRQSRKPRRRTTSRPATQPSADGASSSATSLMPASEATAGGMFR